MNLFSGFKGILKGTVKFSDVQKYSLLTVCIASVHIMLIFVFLYIGSLPMTVYNVFSAAGYFLCLKPVKKKSFMKVYIYTCIEVMLHSVLAVYMAGWNFGFSMYLIAIIPIGFDMAFALDDTVKGIRTAVCFGVLSFATLVICREYSYYFEPVYAVKNEGFVRGVYIFNVMCTCALLILYSYIFAAEIMIAQLDLEKNNKKLDSLASIDALTGLYNRRKMNTILSSAVKNNITFSVIMSDIDNFKGVNDTYGHACGDEVLKMVSEIVAGCLPEEDTVCRWGGEEFLMLSCRPIDEAADIAEKIRVAVESRRLSFDGKDISVTLTLGVSEFTSTSTMDSVITAADKKLYKGKNSGKNCVVK